MTNQPEDQNGERLYFRDSDHELFKLFAEFVFLTTDHLHKLAKRNIVSLRARLRQLHKAGYLQRTTSTETRPVPYFDPPSFVYYLARKGAIRAFLLGFLDDLVYPEEKSRLMLSHDVAITNFHSGLQDAFGSKLTFWEQHRAKLKDQIEIDGQSHAIIPDAIFTLDDRVTYILEVVKARESEYQNGESNVMRKVRAYHNYPEQFRKSWGVADFKVLFILPAVERVRNLVKKMESDYPYRRFMLSHEKALPHLSSNVFFTPKDYPTAYGLLP